MGLRGHGMSTMNAPVEGLDDYSNELLQFIDQKNLTRVYLFGHSFGGIIAYKASILAP